MAKLIPLTQNQFAIVDDHWYEFLMQWKWYARWNPQTKSFYAVRHDKTNHDKTIWMHRIIMNTQDSVTCDHINHNTLDNRESELRNVNSTQSAINRRIFKNNKIGIKGVRKYENGYIAELRHNRKLVLQKKFKTLGEATQARSDAEKKYFGEYTNG